MHTCTAPFHVRAQAPILCLCIRRAHLCLCASVCVPDCLCLTARKENPSGFTPPPHPPKGTASKKRAFPSLLPSPRLCSISRCFSYITAKRVLIWLGRRDGGESVGSFRVPPRSPTNDAFPKLRRQARRVARTRWIPEKAGARLWKQGNAAAAPCCPSAALPRAASPFPHICAHNPIMLYLYSHLHVQFPKWAEREGASTHSEWYCGSIRPPSPLLAAVAGKGFAPV